MEKFWRWENRQIKNESGEINSERVLYLDGPISTETWFGDEITPALFKQELNEDKGNIKIWINSPGGDCIAAAQIYNMLMDYKGEVTVVIDGIAASAASVIAMAGTKVVMSPVGVMMIHNPSTIASGNAEDFEKAIQCLSEIKESIMNAYEIKTGLSREKISELMDKETWMNAKYALEMKFIDEILERNDDKEKKDLISNCYQKKVAEENFTNKLLKKYLITKDNIEKKVEKQITPKQTAEYWQNRLEIIEKII